MSTISQAVGCDWVTGDGEDDTAVCGQLSRFRIERPGDGYIPSESCDGHLAAQIACLLEGEDIPASVTRSLGWRRDVTGLMDYICMLCHAAFQSPDICPAACPLCGGHLNRAEGGERAMTDALDPAAYLAEVRERLEDLGYTEEPGGVMTSGLDAARLLAAVEAVLKVHRPDDRIDGECAGCREECLYCEGDHNWPCPTCQAITAALAARKETTP